MKQSNDIIKIEFNSKIYQLPVQDCEILPLPETTAEYLSSYILSQLLKQISVPNNITKISIQVDEGLGQGAITDHKF